MDSEDEDGQEGEGDDEGDVDSDDELLAGLDADPEVFNPTNFFLLLVVSLDTYLDRCAGVDAAVAVAVADAAASSRCFCLLC